VTDSFDASYYEDVRGRVRGVLISVADVVPREKLAFIEELIDHNEPGIALEMLVDLMIQRGYKPGPQIVEDARRAAKAMAMELPDIDQLEKP